MRAKGAPGSLAGEPERRSQVAIGQVGDQTERMRGIVVLHSFQDPGPGAPAPAALQAGAPSGRTEAGLAGGRLAGRRRDAPAGGGGRAGLGAGAAAERAPAQDKTYG